MQSPQQFPLALTLDLDASFDNFCSDDSTHSVVTYLQQAASGSAENWCLLSGSSGVGKTHLLQAQVNAVLATGRTALYLDCEELITALTPANKASDEDSAEQLLGSLASYDLLAFDNIQALVDNSILQRALFYLLVKLKQRPDSQLLTGSGLAVSQLQSRGLLPDLASRLDSATAFRLNAYNDAQKKKILIFRSNRLGMALGEDVAAYIMQRYSRDLTVLMQALKQLDTLALSQKRGLTIPFVKQVLGI